MCIRDSPCAAPQVQVQPCRIRQRSPAEDAAVLRLHLLQAEGEKASKILVAEGEKQSAILKADAAKQARICLLYTSLESVLYE